MTAAYGAGVKTLATHGALCVAPVCPKRVFGEVKP